MFVCVFFLKQTATAPAELGREENLRWCSNNQELSGATHEDLETTDLQVKPEGPTGCFLYGNGYPK